VKDRFGKTKLVGYEWFKVQFEQCPYILWLHSMPSSYWGYEDQKDPLSEELKNLILALLEKPSLSGDIQFNMLDVRLENIGYNAFTKCYANVPYSFCNGQVAVMNCQTWGKELVPHSTAASK
jgi:hypothetical protein